MNIKHYIFALLGFLLMTSSSGADFYSSMTKVDYVEGSKTLRFTTKLNTEHISNAIKIRPETAGFEAEVKRYVNKNIDLYVNGSTKSLTFTGSQVNGESVWVYFESSGVGEINQLKIRNSILLETYPKQFNVVNVAYKGQQKTMNFTRGRETNQVEF